MNNNIVLKRIHQIRLDHQNPRISEFGVTERTSEAEVIEILWNEMAVNELLLSIVSNGYWQYEPLILLPDGEEKYVVIEGNRRLAALKLIHNDYEVKIPASIKKEITEDLVQSTLMVPCIIVESRKDAWEFIGFKHVNGPAKWGSYAKAKYIAEIHNEFGVDLESIASQIGDTNKTAQKLYQGLMVLEQAKKEKVYDYSSDIQANRLYFSHLYTGLQRDGIRSFLNIKDADEVSPSPVPAESLKNLGQLLSWLFGNKRDNVQAVIKSQNPDLKYLDEVVKSRESLSALRDGESLEYSFELSRADDAVFEENLLAAKRALQKARGYLTNGYDGDDPLLRVAGSVAEMADDLYEEMDKIRRQRFGRKKKNRLTEE